jgi:hypothetical protein
MIKKISIQFVQLCIKEMKKEDNKKIIFATLDPVILHVLLQVKPYVIATVVYFISSFILLVILLVILANKKNA